MLLALDLSTKNSGYAVYDNEQLITYGCVSASSLNLYHRIKKMVSEINEIVVKYDIKSVVIEDVIPEDVRHNQTVFKALTYLQGFITAMLDDLKIPFSFIVSSEWRKKCGIKTGRGIKRETLKQKDINFVLQHFNITVNDDIADAICIGFAVTHENDSINFI